MPMIHDLVFDVGMHKGEDAEFFLKKGFRVVAFEANPDLILRAKLQFDEPLRSGRLNIVAGAIAPQLAGDRIKFYMNSDHSVWGTADSEWKQRNENFDLASEEIEVDRVDMLRTFERFGVPHYLKIDIEGADRVVLEALQEISERPQFVSIESEKVDFERLVEELGLLERIGYKKFKIVQQARIPGSRIRTLTLDGRQLEYVFRDHASGPFGADLPGEWLGIKETICRYKHVFWMYKHFGDGTRYQKLPRIAQLIVGGAYRLGSGYLGPIPGWFDTHASL